MNDEDTGFPHERVQSQQWKTQGEVSIISFPWTQDINWTYIRRWENV